MNKEIIIELNAIIDDVISQLEQGTEVLITGCGNSMKPFIENGEDKVVLEKIPNGKEIREGEIYLYKRSNGKYAIHRIFEVYEDSVSAVGDAQYWVETDIPKSNLVAIVTRVIKKDGTNIDCKDPETVNDSAVQMHERIRIYRKKMRIKRVIRLPIAAAEKLLFIFRKKN